MKIKIDDNISAAELQLIALLIGQSRQNIDNIIFENKRTNNYGSIIRNDTASTSAV